MIAGGALLAALGLAAVPICLIGALLTANPCGAFGDHCTDYGRTSDVADGFVGLGSFSATVAVAGLALLVGGGISRRGRHG